MRFISRRLEMVREYLKSFAVQAFWLVPAAVIMTGKSARVKAVLVFTATLSTVNCLVPKAISRLAWPARLNAVARLAGYPEVFRSKVMASAPELAMGRIPEIPGLLNGSDEGGAASRSAPWSSVKAVSFEAFSSKLTILPAVGEYMTETMTPGFQQ